MAFERDYLLKLHEQGQLPVMPTFITGPQLIHHLPSLILSRNAQDELAALDPWVQKTKHAKGLWEFEAVRPRDREQVKTLILHYLQQSYIETMDLDLQYASLVSYVEIAFFYGPMLPIIYPVATAALFSHLLLVVYIQQVRGVPTAFDTAPNFHWLHLPLGAQMVFLLWFFHSNGLAGLGVLSDPHPS